tara:strand:+ start:150 stop:560 length:411 start_codon:yes stop_codon:yes gene_type:complete
MFNYNLMFLNSEIFGFLPNLDLECVIVFEGPVFDHASEFVVFNDGSIVNKGIFNSVFDLENFMPLSFILGDSLKISLATTISNLEGPISGIDHFTISSIFLLFPDIFLSFFFLSFLLFVLFLKKSFRSLGFTDFVI